MIFTNTGLTARIICAAAILMPTIACADFFKYKDAAGNLIITNRFEDVPPKYRKRVKVIWDSDLEARDPLKRRQAAAEAQRVKEDAARKAQEEQNAGSTTSTKGKTLVYELDDAGQLIRKFE